MAFCSGNSASPCGRGRLPLSVHVKAPWTMGRYDAQAEWHRVLGLSARTRAGQRLQRASGSGGGRALKLGLFPSLSPALTDRLQLKNGRSRSGRAGIPFWHGREGRPERRRRRWWARWQRRGWRGRDRLGRGWWPWCLLPAIGSVRPVWSIEGIIIGPISVPVSGIPVAIGGRVHPSVVLRKAGGACPETQEGQQQ